jgi:hypothetical protein
MNSDYLRKKAREIELLADACYDGHTAQRLRHLADEFYTKADKSEMPKAVPAFILNRSKGSGGNGMSRH